MPLLSFRLLPAAALGLAGFCLTSSAADPVDTSAWTREQDHANMVQQLGITELRRGPNGRPEPGDPHAANYDEAIANPYPDLPPLLTLDNGRPVTNAAQWWVERRPEIVEAFESEIVGRVPAQVPAVTWAVVETGAAQAQLGGVRVVAQKLLGRVDNSAFPAIAVNIEMTVVTPADAPGPVPLLMMFTWRDPGLPTPPDPEADPKAGWRNGHAPSREQLIASGWGYATINPASIQADNGAGLTKGIIGLTNLGQPRQPDDWGALRAWAWGAARGLDYLETYAPVDAQRVGIEGVSRYGKAALVTLAFEPRFAIGLIGSAGEGGTSLYRRHFGEAVENLTGSGQYHWMAGNFLKYGTAASSFGSLNADDLPIDAHSLIALCAPRPTFISYGIPEQGDALWLDQRGSYRATVAAGAVFRLLGVKDLGDTTDYRVANHPAVNSGMLNGALAWRQHDGGHEDQSNMTHFIAWANRFLDHVPPARQ
ncbi:acetylxylan esterase [Synoicihabitans lomoniglobus]|uniref:Acetylxylan esterase n=1 Tax=Synoicihabitans lomoniglobus TaxID=2909285 RepID=A0AAF0A0N8_9BACT|nr:acetylxylan esterase [Opitutaceae bacterium LMO-M01]WED64357.1 acetylxylan esterase [Opitutaceae bacterium LMO-M01]